MNGFVRKMEDAFVAIAFSEIGEHGIALEFLALPAASTRLKIIAENHSRLHIPLVPEGDP
jgi:hypothetical protein